MSDFDETKYEPVPDPAGKPVAFCQNCGKPLDEHTKRVVGPAVYCEPCLMAKLGGAAAPGATKGAAAGSGFPSGFNVGGSSVNWNIPSSWNPGSVPNPGLAALLGFIPGVGAMYNEQYAKGIFHLIVFSLLISLSHAAGIFILLVFGWEFYMVIEAHHTARARRDGTPLPNPFGLNEIGERLGFSRGWAPGPGQPPPAGAPAGTPWAGPVGGQPYPPASTPGSAAPGAATWGAPAEGFDPITGAPNTGAPASAVPPTNFPGSSYGPQYAPVHGTSYSATPGYNAPYNTGYVPPIPPVPPYGMPYAPVPPVGAVEPPFIPKPNRFPSGAIWLIGLGTLFLLSTTGIFETLFGWSLVGFVLIGLAVWIFVRRMMDTGVTLGNDGSAGYWLRLVRALGPSVWVLLVGVLLLLNEFDILRWHRSWPLFIILAGVMALLQRAALNMASSASFPVSPAGPAASAAGSNPYSVVPEGPAVHEVKDRSNEGVL